MKGLLDKAEIDIKYLEESIEDLKASHKRKKETLTILAQTFEHERNQARAKIREKSNDVIAEVLKNRPFCEELQKIKELANSKFSSFSQQRIQRFSNFSIILNKLSIVRSKT